ncbi:MAG: glycosyltransferase family 4 protein [archaeon]|nr:glycosyltransferase family 4 protein [archaeon]
MKICYVNPTNNIRRPIAELAEILVKEGHNIGVLFPVSKECPTKNWVANDRVKQSAVQRIPVASWYFSPLRYSFPNPIQLFKGVRKVVKNYDKIHVWEYYYPLSVMTLLYAFFTCQRDKIILTTDGFVGYSYKPKRPRWLVPAFKLYTQLFARLLFKIPPIITTYGKSMLPYAEKAGVPMSKLKVIPTGIHLERFQNVSNERVEQLREEFSIKDEKVILFVGMLTERKGVDKVIDVSIKLLEEGMNIKTLIVGDAHGKNIYQKMVPERYKDKIIFAGGRRDIPELMKLADVLLLPSEGEGLPGVVMEAMAAGLPVVATREGCTPDLIEDGVGGYLVRMDENFEGYQEMILKLFQSKLSKDNAVKIVRSNIFSFRWPDVTKKYNNLYQK